MRSTENRLARLLRDERGGVHTEGAMVALFLAMMFGGFLWIQARMMAEMRAVRIAGRDVWNGALMGCDTGRVAPAQSIAERYRSTIGDSSPEALDRLQDVVESDRSAADTETARQPEVLGGGSVEVNATAGTACNTDMPEGAFEVHERVIEYFCDLYPNYVTPNWPGGCTIGGPGGE